MQPRMPTPLLIKLGVFSHRTKALPERSFSLLFWFFISIRLDFLLYGFHFHLPALVQKKHGVLSASSTRGGGLIQQTSPNPLFQVPLCRHTPPVDSTPDLRFPLH